MKSPTGQGLSVPNLARYESERGAGIPILRRVPGAELRWRRPRPSGLDEIGSTFQVTAHLANVEIWFWKYVEIDLIYQKVDTSVHYYSCEPNGVE